MKLLLTIFTLSLFTIAFGQDVEFKSSNFKDQFGIERQSATVSTQAMKVVEAYADSALLVTFDDYPLSNIQINDIATIKPIQ